jgi:hypothetical protein
MEAKVGCRLRILAGSSASISSVRVKLPLRRAEQPAVQPPDFKSPKEGQWQARQVRFGQDH